MLTGTELEVLQRIGKEGSGMDYRTLAAKTGFGSHTTKVLCQSLDKAGYIALSDLTRCVLTPKGREELRSRGLLEEKKEPFAQTFWPFQKPGVDWPIQKLGEERAKVKGSEDPPGQENVEVIEREKEEQPAKGKVKFAWMEKREKSMLEKIVSLMSRDGVFEQKQERWEVGQVSCFVTEKPQEGWCITLVALEPSKFMERWGWDELLGVYHAELDSRLKLKEYDQIAPDEVEGFPQVIEFLKEKGLGANLEAKAAKWRTFHPQQRAPEWPETPGAGMPPENIELRALKVLARWGGRLIGRSLAQKMGQDYGYMDQVVFRSLGKKDYIDYLGSGVCVLTPKGRELLKGMGWLIERKAIEQYLPPEEREREEAEERKRKESAASLARAGPSISALVRKEMAEESKGLRDGELLRKGEIVEEIKPPAPQPRVLLPQIPREEIPLDDTELEILKALAASGGRAIGRNLSIKLGYGYESDHIGHIYHSLAKEDYIDYLGSGVCVLAPKGRELLGKAGLIEWRPLIQPREPQISPEEVSLDNLQLRILRTLTSCDRGRLAGQELANKIGQGDLDYMDGIYRDLGKEGYINYLEDSQLCVLTPKGKELLKKKGEWLVEELELKILKALADAGGRMIGRNLAAKLGKSNLDYMDRFYRDLGKEEYIDYLGSGVCILTSRGRKLLEKKGWIAKEEKPKPLSPEEKERKEARASLATIRPSMLAEARREMAQEVGLRRNPAVEALKRQMEAREREEGMEELLLEQEEKSSKEGKEKEASMLRKLVRFMYRDNVFDDHQESWEFGQIRCFVDGTPDYGWTLLVLLLEQSEVVLRWGWEKILGVYLVELDNQRNLQNYVRMPPDKIKEVGGLMEFLKEKGLGDNIEEKIAKWEAFELQKKEREEERTERMKGPLKHLIGTEIDALEKLGATPKGKIHYLHLGWKLGVHRSYSRVICNTLGKAEYIDFNMASGICEITPKGKLFLKEREKPKKAKEAAVWSEKERGWLVKEAEAIVEKEMREYEPVRHTGRPTGTELLALETLADLGGKADYKRLSRKMGRNSNYARLLCRSLGKGDYVDFSASGICELTTKGKEELRKRGKLKEEISGQKRIPWQEELKKRGVIK